MVSNRLKKSIKAVFAAMIIAVSAITVYAGCFAPGMIHAEETATVKKGRVKDGVSNLNIRQEPDTSKSNVITKVSTGFTFDILDTVYTTETYYWYKISFDLDGVQTEGYVSGEYTEIIEDIEYEEDGDFEAYLTEQNFPESYKDALRELHTLYPKWIFVADHNGVDWDYMVSMENVLGRSTIENYNISSWKSTADGCYDWSTGEWVVFDSNRWVQASPELVEYALDPRNFLNSTNIFMFENLSYDDRVQTTEGVTNIIKDTFMYNSTHELTYNNSTFTYPTAIMYAGSLSGVSPLHLAARIRQEMGVKGTSGIISGTHATYPNIYNYYNIRAYGSDPVSVGLEYASQTDEATLRPWDTRMKAIIGGAKWLGNNYINQGQNTLYYQKFDIVRFWHQYMSNILGAKSESVSASKGYTDEFKKETSFIFKIPVYDNMPDEACPLPTGDGSPNYMLNSLTVDGFSLTPTFDMFTTDYSLIVDYSDSEITIAAAAVDSEASIAGVGKKTLKVGTNIFEIVVTAGNGDKRTYKLTVVRKTEDESEKPGYSTDLTIKDKYVSGIEVGTKPNDVILKFVTTGKAYIKIFDKNDKERTGNVCTGDVVVVYKPDGTELERLTVVIYGDVNGDGDVTSMDLTYIKRHVLDIKKLEGAYLQAGDADRKGNGVTSMDLVYVKRHILDIKQISQK